MPNYKVFLPVCILVPVTAVLIVPAYLEDNWGNSSENNKRKLNIAHTNNKVMYSRNDNSRKIQ